MRDYFKLRKSKLLLLALLTMIGGVSSAWADAKALPYSYDFSGALATEGWTMQSCHSSTGISNGAFRFYYNTNPPQFLISPELQPISSTVDVSFEYKVQSSSYVESFQVGYSTTDNNTESFTWDNQVDPTNTSYTTYETTFPAGVKYVAIRYNANDKYYLFIDNFKICKTPTCITPRDLTTADITSSSVTLSWASDADAWNVQYKKAADSDWTDISGSITSKSYSMTGLNPATDYQARVRTYCDATDQSDWTDAISFTTDCATLTIDATHSFSEDFGAGNTLPACWAVNNENKTGGNGWTITSNMSYSGYYGDTYLILPPMQLSVVSQLVFDNYFNYVTDYNGTTAKSSIVISTTGTAAADFTNTLYTFTKSELPSTSSTVLPKEISLVAYTGQTVYIAFKYEGKNAHAWYVDNVVVEEAPACVKPTALAASNVFYDRATLSWTAGSDETEWKVIYGAAGFDPASEGTTVSSIIENPYTLTGLTPETAYDVYVKAVKGSDESALSDKASFTTTVRYPTPTGLAISNLTTTSATLTWTAGAATSWEVAINTTGETPATETGTGTVVNTAAYDFSELTTETTYFAFVREKDGENFSSWSAACEFTPSAYTYLTVNEGTTTNSYVPVYGYFSAAANLGGQFIIPAANLTDVQNKVIKKLTFYSNTSEYDYAEAEFDVCVKEISDANMSSSMYAWDNGTWTTVYNGKLAVSGGKMNIVFTSDFNYTGSNLLIGIHKTSTDKSGSNYNVSFYGNNASSYMSNYSPNGNRQKFQPKTTIGYQEKTGSELKLFDGESELAESPASFDFGLAEAGTTHVFTLVNTASTPYVATISSENLTVSPTEVTPDADGETITVTMPAQDITNEAVVITPAHGSGLEPFIINVSGTLRDANKFYVPGFTTQPTGWTAEGSWSYSTTNGASTSAWELASNARLKTPMLTVAAGEKFIFEAKGTAYSGNESYQHLVLEYSADGTNWTAIGDEVSLTSSFKTFTLTTPNDFVAGNYYIALHGSQAGIRMFYGGVEVPGANFAINTDGSTQNFGSVKFGATAQKSYTVTNSGNADLLVTLTAEDGFTATGNTMLFTNTKGWSAVKVHAWNGEGNLTEWPGVDAPYYGKNSNNEDQYVIAVPAGATGIVINNGNGQQSSDITDFNKEGYYLSGDVYDSNKYWADSWGDHPTLLTVAAGESKQFTVTMNTATSGDKSGNVVLSFDALNATEFTIPCTGNVKDENYLVVDFQDNQFPEGWQTGADWSIASASSNYYAVQSNTKTASALVTTPLTVAENETLTFKACRNVSGYGYVTSLKTRYSTDGGANWSEYVTRTIDSGSLTEYALTGVPAGKVIIEFLGSNIKLDDIEGLTKTAAPAIALTEAGAAVANGATKDLGNLSADGTATYTVKNIGNAALSATISGEGITISPASIELAAGATADITVTLAYSEPYGEKTGKLTIDAADEWIGNFEVNFTATLVDPNDFVIDFESGKPEGWYFDTWNVSNGVATINTGNAKRMITELLGAEEGKNTLTFDAKMAYDYGTGNQTLNVYTSADRKTWSEAQTFSLTAASQTFSLTALADGNYYVKFEAANAAIDNFKGVKKLTAPEHDLFLVSATLPTTEITPIDTYTATVNVASLRADETVAAELYFGETKVAELTNQPIDKNATKAFTLTGNAPAAGTYDVYAKVYNGNVTVETEKVSVTVADKTELSLTGFAAVSNSATADDNNQFTADFNVTVKNTGSTAFTADQISVTVTDGSNNDLQTATWTPGETIYLKAGNYIADNANFAIYRWSTDSDQEWALFTEGANGIYNVGLNGKDNFIICRVNPAVALSDLSFTNGVWTKSNDLTAATGVVFENNGYQDGKLNLTQSNSFLAGMSATIKVSVAADAGNGGEFSFNAKENVSGAYWYSTLGNLQYVNVTAAPAIVLNENSSDAFATGQNRKVRLNRTFVAGWNTICLPFTLTPEEIATGAKALAFTAYDTNTKELTFSPVTELEANKPYVIWVENAITEPIEFTGKTVTTSDDPETAFNGVTFQGTYTSMAAGSLTGMWGLTASGKIAKAGASTTMKGFRAYFDGIPATGATARFLDDESTGISSITIDGSAEGVYNLQGQKVEQLHKGGLYIINGKKVVIK